jgi:hypothetical protein
MQAELFAFEMTGEYDTWNILNNTKYYTKTLYSELMARRQSQSWKYGNHVVYLDTKFFAWLLLYNRLNTKEMMKKKNFYLEYNDCILCDTCHEETVTHLFFEYSFSQSFWWGIGMEWNSDYDIYNMILDAKHRYLCPFHMEIRITSYWRLWGIRGDFWLPLTAIDDEMGGMRWRRGSSVKEGNVGFLQRERKVTHFLVRGSQI